MSDLVIGFACTTRVRGLQRFGWGQKKTDELLKLALAQGKVELDVAARGEHVYTAAQP